MDRNKENTGVSLNTKGDNEDDDDFEDDDEDFEDEDVRAREFQLKLRAERRRLERDLETPQRESQAEGTGRKDDATTHTTRYETIAKDHRSRNAQKIIDLKRRSHMTKNQVHLLRDQIGLSIGKLLVQTFGAINAHGEIKGFSNRVRRSRGSLAQFRIRKWNKDMLDALMWKFKAKKNRLHL